MMKSKSIPILVALFLIYTSFGDGVFTGVVLCIGANDHFAYEPTHDNSHFFESASGFDHANHQTTNHVTFSSKSSDSCVDIPISIKSLARNQARVQELIHNTNILADDGNVSPSAAWTQVPWNAILKKISSSISSPITYLKTTILLI